MGNTLDWDVMASRGNNPSINMLPNEVLLEIFNFCRLNSVFAWNYNGWYKLTHICRRWRYTIFSSPSSLDLQLYCTYSSPVSEILSQSPPFPLIVDYGGQRPLPANDEEGALLALQKHDRVRYIDLHASGATIDKLFAVMNGPFPVLEDLWVSVEYPGSDEDESEGNDTDCPRLPPKFHAPHLRRLDLDRSGEVAELGLPRLASFSGLLSLALKGIPISIYLPLDYLASCLSLMPRLEYLGLVFDYNFVPNDISLRQRRIDVPNLKRISLPNLSEILFRGESSYLEGLAAWIIGSAPLLTRFHATLFGEPLATLSHLPNLLSAAAGLKLPVASITFSGMRVDVPTVAISMARSEQTLDRWQYLAPFRIVSLCEPLNVQAASAGEICAALTPMFSAVERLHLDLSTVSYGLPSDIDRARWPILLRPFHNVEKLQVDAGLMEGLSAALHPSDDSSMELLPKLRKLTRPDYTRFRGTFDDLIAARRDAGKDITKRRRPPLPYSDSDSEEECEEDEDDNNEEDEEEGEEESEEEEQEEGAVDLEVEDERESITELDSDSDLYSEHCIE